MINIPFIEEDGEGGYFTEIHGYKTWHKAHKDWNDEEVLDLLMVATDLRERLKAINELSSIRIINDK